MVREQEELLKLLSDYVFEMKDDEIKEIAKEYLDSGYDPLQGILKGLVDGMNKAGKMYEEEEYFVTDLLVCSDAMYNGLDIFRPQLPKKTDDSERVFKCVIGVVEGDTHDIGKNLVKIMLETSGFEMYDLGRDVPIKNFVDKAKEVEADIICLSTLMTTTMPRMKEVVDILEEENLHEKIKVMVGGGPISQAFCDKIGADGYSANAIEAVKLAKLLTSITV